MSLNRNKAHAVAVATEVTSSHTKRVELQQEVLLQAWSCTLRPKSTLYVSGPMTTGRRFVDWYKGFGKSIDRTSRNYSSEHKKRVLLPNCRDIKLVADRLRGSQARPVVEPTGIEF